MGVAAGLPREGTRLVQHPSLLLLRSSLVEPGRLIVTALRSAIEDPPHPPLRDAGASGEGGPFEDSSREARTRIRGHFR